MLKNFKRIYAIIIAVVIFMSCFQSLTFAQGDGDLMDNTQIKDQIINRDAELIDKDIIIEDTPISDNHDLGEEGNFELPDSVHDNELLENAAPANMPRYLDIPEQMLTIPEPTEVKTVTITPANHTAIGLNFSETRTKGHNEFVEDGLRVWTDSNDGESKAVGYILVDMLLAEIGKPELTFLKKGNEQLPGLQLLVYDTLDGSYKYLARESDHPEHGDNWWSRDTFGGLPGKENTYRNFFGSLDDLYNYNPGMIVLAIGYSLGSGAKGDVVLESMTFGDTKYFFSANRFFDVAISYKNDMDIVGTQTFSGLEEGTSITKTNLEFPLGYAPVSLVFSHVVRGASTVVVNVEAIRYSIILEYIHQDSAVGSQVIIDKLYGETITSSNLIAPDGYYVESFSPITVTEDTTISIPVSAYAQVVKAADNNSITIEPEEEDIQLNVVEDFSVSYLNGYPDGTIRPNGNLSRAEMTQVIWNLLGGESYVPEMILNFSDTTEDIRAYNTINFAVSKNLMVGYPDGSFGVNKNITRAEFTAILARIKNINSTGISKFYDVDGHWAQKYIQSMEAEGFLSGYEDGSFAPDQFITRAEVAVILNKSLGLSQTLNINSSFSDLPKDFWAYSFMMNVVNGLQ